jgi:hypothetical protein
LQESGQAPNRRIIIKAENATYSFDPDMVLYVEAIGKVCTVYMMNRTMVIRQPIIVLETQFPKQFCRIHRSYLVNCRFVLQVERYSVTLINGTVLPVPAKRYMEVREKITALIKNENQEATLEKTRNPFCTDPLRGAGGLQPARPAPGQRTLAGTHRHGKHSPNGGPHHLHTPGRRIH